MHPQLGVHSKYQNGDALKKMVVCKSFWRDFPYGCLFGMLIFEGFPSWCIVWVGTIHDAGVMRLLESDSQPERVLKTLRCLR